MSSAFSGNTNKNNLHKDFLITEKGYTLPKYAPYANYKVGVAMLF